MLSGGKILYGRIGYDAGDGLEVRFSENDMSQAYRCGNFETKDYNSVQGKKLTKPKYRETLPWRTVYISPFDMNLLYFAPTMRRDTMDDALSRAYEQFSKVERDYTMTLKSRNALLKRIKDGFSKKEELTFWDKKFAEYADIYGLYRERFIMHMKHKIGTLPNFFGKYTTTFHYDSSWIESENRREYIEAYLLENRDRDILTGHTHI
jgi:recombinational DNA repair ATPase RecF